jgi:hypothetical protein
VAAGGEIDIRLAHHHGRARRVNIDLRRPQAARVLIGKTPEQLLEQLPLLFSVCGNAQAYAALLACRAALGLPAPVEADRARELLVDMEILREHVWRMGLDWSGFVDLPADKTALAALLKFDTRFKQLLFEDGDAFTLHSRLRGELDFNRLLQLINELTGLIDGCLFGNRLQQFLSLSSEAQLGDWISQNSALPARLLAYVYHRDWEAAGNNAVMCLPAINCERLHAEWQQVDLGQFSRFPHWQNQCWEVTPLNRQCTHPLLAALSGHYGNGLLVRLTASLLEVAGILDKLISKTPASGSHFGHEGVGLAQVAAARGLLIHRLALRHGRVYDYAIVAPTEWNFHPGGVVTQGLQNLRADTVEDLQRQAALLINAIDPCVTYRLTLMEQVDEVEVHA